MPVPTQHDPDQPATRRTLTVDRFTASATDLLDHRTDLRGVTPMADLIYDSVRWCA